MRNLSRRTMLARTAATIPAAAIGAAPALSSPLGAVSFPDLAGQFARLYPRWRDRTNESHASLDRFDAKLKAATGLSRDEAPAVGDPGWDEYHAVLMSLPHDHADDDPVNELGESIVWAEIYDELWPLIDDILEQPAKTLADLAIQAQVMAVENHEFWTNGMLGQDEYRLRLFVESVCALAGVEPLPGVNFLRPVDNQQIA